MILLLSLLWAAEYPPHWWEPVPRDEAPQWEVLPQDAGPGEVILSKRNELGILSNFAHTPFVLDGKSYESLEGFWQMMKYPDPLLQGDPRWGEHTREAVSQMIGFEAKKAGSLGSKVMRSLGIDWVSYHGQKMKYRSPKPRLHYELIHRAMVAKLEQNPEVGRILRLTGDLVLRPDHAQGDDVPPEWKYHQIWMALR